MQNALSPVLVTLALVLPVGVRAEDPPPIEVIALDVRQERVAEFEEFLHRLAEASRRTRSPVRWTAHAPAQPDRHVYLVVLRPAGPRDAEEWSRFEPASVLTLAFGAEEARRILALREGSLAGLSRSAYTARPDLSHAD